MLEVLFAARSSSSHYRVLPYACATNRAPCSTAPREFRIVFEASLGPLLRFTVNGRISAKVAFKNSVCKASAANSATSVVIVTPAKVIIVSMSFLLCCETELFAATSDS
jgi:hypothetical protein